MRLVHPVAAAALTVLATATGCAGGTSHADIAKVPTAGVIVTVGGPAPGAPAPIPGVELRLIGAGGSVNVRADRHGRFTANLAPGRYRVRITGRGPMADGRPMQPVPARFVVSSAAADHVRLIVSIK